MRVIYNEAIARENFVAQEKREKKQDLILGVAGGFCLTSFATLILTIVFAEYIPFYPTFCMVSLWGAGISGCVFIWVSFNMSIFTPAPDVVYYQESQKRKVLEVKVKYESRTEGSVFMYSEREDGIVLETKLCRAVFQPSTKHNTETFDVHKGVIFTPYKASHSRTPVIEKD